jgi:hypothetical protein
MRKKAPVISTEAKLMGGMAVIGSGLGSVLLLTGVIDVNKKPTTEPATPQATEIILQGNCPAVIKLEPGRPTKLPNGCTFEIKGWSR